MRLQISARVFVRSPDNLHWPANPCWWARMAKLHINFWSKWLKAPVKEVFLGGNDDVLVLSTSRHSCRLLLVLLVIRLGRASTMITVWWTWRSDFDWWRVYIKSGKVHTWLGSAEDGFGPFARQRWCQAGFGSHEAGNFGDSGGDGEIEVAPNFARTRPCRGRNSNFMVYLCANPVAGCMVLLKGARNLWSRAFLGRGDALDNQISCWPSPSSKKPYQFDFWQGIQPESGRGDLA